MKLLAGDTSLFTIINDPNATLNNFSSGLDKIKKGYRDTLLVSQFKQYSLPAYTEVIFLELNLRATKWLICCFCNPHKNLLSQQLQTCYCYSI